MNYNAWWDSNIGRKNCTAGEQIMQKLKFRTLYLYYSTTTLQFQCIYIRHAFRSKNLIPIFFFSRDGARSAHIMDCLAFLCCGKINIQAWDWDKFNKCKMWRMSVIEFFLLKIMSKIYFKSLMIIFYRYKFFYIINK